MTQPASKSEEAVRLLSLLVRERGCADKSELRRIFVEMLREWGERSATTRFYEALRRLVSQGKIYTDGERICITDEEIRQLEALFCDITRAITYTTVSRSDERFLYWASNGRIVKYIFDKIAQLGISGQHDLKLPEASEEAERVALARAYREAGEWFKALRAFLSALSASNSIVAFIDDPIALAYIIGFLARREDPVCQEFSLKEQLIITTTCRVAADVFSAVRRYSSDVGTYVVFPLSSNRVEASSPYFMTVLPCRVVMDSETLKWKAEGVFSFGVILYAMLDTPKRLAQFFNYVRIVEIEGGACDFCRTATTSTA